MRTTSSIIYAALFAGLLLLFIVSRPMEPLEKEAEASIFEQVALEDLRVPPFPTGGLPTMESLSEPRRAIINSIPISYMIGTRQASPSQILDFYSGFYGEKAIRLEGTGWGAVRVIGVDTGVLVFTAGPSDPAVLLIFWIEGNSHLSHFIPAEGDLPGRDPDNIPRYPGARRIFSLELKEPGSPAHLALYEGEGSFASTMKFYQSRMASLGWQERSPSHQKNGGLLLFTHEKAECIIQITHSEGKTLITVIRRET